MPILIVFCCVICAAIVLFLVYTIVPTYYNKFLNRKIIHRTKTKNQIMLSFDDGPDERYTNSLLDVLKQENVRATFFVVAKNAEKNKPIISRMQAENHEIALHSLEHKNAMFYGYKYAKNDFAQSIAIMQKLQVKASFYRPPWGHSNIFTSYFANKFNLKIMLWSVMAEDWSKYAKPETILTKLILRTKSNSIICLHDGGGAEGAPINTIAALSEAIRLLKSKGYTFITASEVL